MEKSSLRINFYPLICLSMGILCCLFALFPDGSAQAQTKKKVLFISSYSYEWKTVPKQLEGIASVLQDKAEISYMFMDTKTVSKKIAFRNLKVKLMAYYNNGQNYDVVVTGDDAALDFVLEYRNRFFPDTPIVFEGVDSRKKAESAAADYNITGVFEKQHFQETLEFARTLLPESDTVVLIMNDAESGKGIAEQYIQVQAQMPQMTFEVLRSKDYTYTELIQQIEEIREDAIVLFSSLTSDGDGRNYAYDEGLSLVREHTGAMIFSSDGISMGSGILGSVGNDYKQMAASAAQMAAQILDGGSVSALPMQETEGVPMADYSVMEQYHVGVDDLPADTLIMNGPEKVTLQEFVADNLKDVIWTLFTVSITVVIVLLLLRLHERQQKKQINTLTGKLSRQEEEFRLVLRQTGTISWIYDYNTKRAKQMNSQDTFCTQRGKEFLDNVPEYFLENEMVHPESREEFIKMYQRLLTGVRTTEGIFRIRLHVDGPWTWQKITYSNRYDSQGNAYEAIGFANDITLQKKQERDARLKEETDVLTGLYNRHAFEHLANRIFRDRRDSRSRNVLCIFDLDSFRAINEQYGHQVGDRVLQEFAGVLLQSGRQSDIVGRLDGDVFVLLYTGVKDIKMMQGRMLQIREKTEGILLPDREHLSVSAGIASAVSGECSFDELFRRADTALKEAKQRGQNQHCFFENL